MTHRSSIFAIALAAAAIFTLMGPAACRKKAADPFPATDAASGWKKTSATRIFAAKDLYQYIDGDADQYVAAGVVTTSTSDYKYQGKIEATADVFEMGDVNGAQKMLDAGSLAGGKQLAIGDGGIAFAQSVLFRKGPYLVRIVAYQGDPDTPLALSGLAQAIAGKL
ncbi:MAG TPA: DUF6599 family protein [Terracidiphilus sp.]|nr:DUF6599 family protein [Terracidiphilus sp.]